MERKIIQITVAIGSTESGIIYALCNDGTLWWKCEDADQKWELDMNAIPQSPFYNPALKKPPYINPPHQQGST